MMRRWGHGHSTVAGLVLGLTLAQHGWLLVAVGVVAGFGLSRIGGLLGAVRRRVEPPSHPCGQCGSPIDSRSRANYCSPACRQLARLEREERQHRAELVDSFGEEAPF